MRLKIGIAKNHCTAVGLSYRQKLLTSVSGHQLDTSGGPTQVAQNSDLHKRYMFKYSVQVKEAKSANLKLRPDLLGQMELMEAKLHMTDPQV